MISQHREDTRVPTRLWAGPNHAGKRRGRSFVLVFFSFFDGGGLPVSETHPSQALLQGVQDDELGEVEVLLRGFSKYPLQGRIGETGRSRQPVLVGRTRNKHS